MDRSSKSLERSERGSRWKLGRSGAGRGDLMSKVVSSGAAAARIADGAVVTVSSSSALGCPDAVLEAIGERFRAEGHPRGSDHAPPDRRGRHVRREGHRPHRAGRASGARLAGSYPSGPSNLPMPEIWKMIVEDRVPAYNVPSGILFDMHREAAARRPGVLTRWAGDLRRSGPRGLRDERRARPRPSSSARGVRRARPGCISRTSSPTSASCAPRRRTRTAT
jgi:hypothetical protein